MAILPILCFPDPRLHKVAQPVAQVDERIQTLVKNMIETMYDAQGIGLAATQIDVHERVVVIDVSESRLLTPQVKRFYCLREQRRITPEIVDLASPSARNSIIGREDPADWPFKNLEELWHGFTATHP